MDEQWMRVRLEHAFRVHVRRCDGAAVVESKPKRPEYKFQKKPARTKGNRGKADDGNAVYDGAAFTTGRRGGLVRTSATT